MGFKSMTSYNSQNFGNFFRLQNDGDFADVIILYRNTDDVMIADTHYIKSDSYSGYVTCCETNCPACKKNIRVQTKLFIPLYVLKTTDPNGQIGRIQFWDRTIRFQPQLVNDVFRSYPNPAEFIFRITRHGVAGSIDTTYDIRAIDQNKEISYDDILSKNQVTFPDYYNSVCKEVNSFELESMLSTSSYGNNTSGYGNFNNNANNYGASPRGASNNTFGSNSGYGSGSNFGSSYGNEYGNDSQPFNGAGNTMNSNPFENTNPFESGEGLPSMSTPNVSINTSPQPSPDPGNLPFGSSEVSISSDSTESSESVETRDPLETNEDIDMTDLDF